MSRARAGAAAFVAAMAAAGCSSGPRLEAYRPPQPPVVLVSMTEYRVVHARPVPAGRVVFGVINRGFSPHRLSLVALAEDSPPADQQLGAGGLGDAVPVAQMPVLQPTQDSTFAAELEPGTRYALLSLHRTSDGRTDAERGMVAEFRAQPPGP